MTADDEMRPGELFNVVQLFTTGESEYVRRNVSPEQAADAMWHYSNSVGARAGIVERVLITDNLDRCCALWERERGLVFPPPKAAA